MMTDTKPLANEITAWLKNYTDNANRKALVVGVSGGVDSALVSTLCAMTGIDTYCVVLPCESRTDQMARAYQHISWLQTKFPNVKLEIIDLTTPYQNMKKEFGKARWNPLALANTKSRIRMIALYQVATCVDGLVVGTGNKVEDFGVGFFTKYGDGGVDISPISDLMKSEVRQMCRDLGVLPALCDAIPTDGLWDDSRTDETQLGCTYDELEWAMMYDAIITGDRGDLTDRQRFVLDVYRKRHAATLHKLAPIPTFKRNETNV